MRDPECLQKNIVLAKHLRCCCGASVDCNLNTRYSTLYCNAVIFFLRQRFQMLFFIVWRGVLADGREMLCWLAHVYVFEGCGVSFEECCAPVNFKGVSFRI